MPVSLVEHWPLRFGVHVHFGVTCFMCQRILQDTTSHGGSSILDSAT